ncbi:MAG TPA: hypothetical protein VLZ07_12805 [Syntrophales bacterium]|nr:hypothetical protein [Syntrophales bacterium]
MTLRQWEEYGWLRRHKTDRKEIKNLLAIIDRSLLDAAGNVSADARFAIAYNAALQLCTVLLHAAGYRSETSRKHERTIKTLPLILGKEKEPDAKYLDTCRTKRHIVEYDYVGSVTGEDVRELVAYVQELRGDVIDWLNEYHPDLL